MKLQILNNNYYLTLEEYSFNYRWIDYIIPQFFYWNWGSLPRVLWFISHPVMQPYVLAFLIHDFMYSNKWPKIPRKECDEFFLYNISLQNKIVWLLFYMWVRLFWKKHYKKDLPFKKI
jgi:hypothetical protein